MLMFIFWEILERDFIATKEDMFQALNKKEIGRQYSEDYCQEPKGKIDKLKDQPNRRKYYDQSHHYHDGWSRD